MQCMGSMGAMPRLGVQCLDRGFNAWIGGAMPRLGVKCPGSRGAIRAPRAVPVARSSCGGCAPRGSFAPGDVLRGFAHKSQGLTKIQFAGEECWFRLGQNNSIAGVLGGAGGPALPTARFGAEFTALNGNNCPAGGAFVTHYRTGCLKPETRGRGEGTGGFQNILS